MAGFCKNAYCRLTAVGNCFQSFLLLAMRLYWGGSFMLSGWGKWHHVSAIGDYFATLGIPFPLVNAYLVSSIECIGGICLLFGLASRLICIPLICVMMGALLTEHRAALLNTLQDPEQLIAQLPFNYLLTALIVFAFGPGKISVDYLIERFCCHTSGESFD